MSGFIDKWDQQTAAVKTIWVAMLIAIFIVPLMAFYLLYSPKLVPLYQNLSEQDAAKVVAQLEANKVEYVLNNQGRDIFIQDDKVHDARLQLVSDGVQLGGGVGFELFDDMDYGMTDFAQKINFQRALQGELSRTISSHKAIRYARVHLVLPEATLFENQTKEPKASVTLLLEDGKVLAASQIQGIQKLVGNSVEGLDPSRVIVNDSDGNILSQDALEETYSLGKVLSKKQEIEASLTEKCNAILNKIFGDNKTIVSIDVALSSSEIKRRTESVLAGEDGKTGVLVSKKRSTTKKQNKSGKKGSSNQNNVSELEEVAYKTGLQIEEAIVGAGQIERLSISALIPVGVTNTQLNDIKDLLERAVGFDESRGDAIAVRRLPVKFASTEKSFTDEIVPAEGNQILASATETQSLDSQLIAFAAGGVGLLIGLVSLVLFAFRNNTPSLTDAERQIVLSNIRNWIETDESVIEGEKVS